MSNQSVINFRARINKFVQNPVVLAIYVDSLDMAHLVPWSRANLASRNNILVSLLVITNFHLLIEEVVDASYIHSFVISIFRLKSLDEGKPIRRLAETV